jgi:zinc finger SWIM domain-containing protein 3
MVTAQDKASWQWYVKDFIDEPNHPLAKKDFDSLLRPHRRITDEEKVCIKEMGISRI